MAVRLALALLLLVPVAAPGAALAQQHRPLHGWALLLHGIDLDAWQRYRIREAMAEERRANEAPGANAETRRQNGLKLRRTIEAILTPEQREHYQANVEQARSRRPSRR